jgi:hypothetical protein
MFSGRVADNISWCAKCAGILDVPKEEKSIA